MILRLNQYLSNNYYDVLYRACQKGAHEEIQLLINLSNDLFFIIYNCIGLISFPSNARNSII